MIVLDLFIVEVIHAWLAHTMFVSALSRCCVEEIYVGHVIPHLEETPIVRLPTQFSKLEAAVNQKAGVARCFQPLLPRVADIYEAWQLVFYLTANSPSSLRAPTTCQKKCEARRAKVKRAKKRKSRSGRMGGFHLLALKRVLGQKTGQDELQTCQ